MKNRIFKGLIIEIETLLVRGLLGLFARLPLDMASTLGGKTLRLFGRFTSRHKVALKNLALVFPDKSEAERQKIALKMWEHLGRLFGELPFLDGNLLTARILDVKGLEYANAHPQVIYISGHFGQWELLNSVIFDQKIKIASVYRHLNNTKLDEVLRKLRLHHTSQLIRKKGDSAIAMVRVLNQGTNLSLLVDQRLTNGEVLPFLGHPAKTNTSAAKLALKMNLPLIPAFITRTKGKGVYFYGEMLPPLEIARTGNEEDDVKNLTLAFNQLLEARIRAHPEQWLWLHDRWK